MCPSMVMNVSNTNYTTYQHHTRQYDAISMYPTTTTRHDSLAHHHHRHQHLHWHRRRRNLDSCSRQEPGSSIIMRLSICLTPLCGGRHYAWRCETPRCSSCPPALPSCVVPSCGDSPPEDSLVSDSELRAQPVSTELRTR